MAALRWRTIRLDRRSVHVREHVHLRADLRCDEHKRQEETGEKRAHDCDGLGVYRAGGGTASERR